MSLANNIFYKTYVVHYICQYITYVVSTYVGYSHCHRVSGVSSLYSFFLAIHQGYSLDNCTQQCLLSSTITYLENSQIQIYYIFAFWNCHIFWAILVRQHTSIIHQSLQSTAIYSKLQFQKKILISALYPISIIQCWKSRV